MPTTARLCTSRQQRKVTVIARNVCLQASCCNYNYHHTSNKDNIKLLEIIMIILITTKSKHEGKKHLDSLGLNETIPKFKGLRFCFLDINIKCPYVNTYKTVDRK
jgi:hypothetical protein